MQKQRKKTQRLNKQLNVRIPPDLLFRLKRVQLDRLQDGVATHLKDMVVDYIEHGLAGEEVRHGAP